MMQLQKIPGINYDLNNRWENGTPHHPKSIELMKRVSELDFHINGDHFCWKIGGDGDSGEIFMYVLDVFFEEQDKING